MLEELNIHNYALIEKSVIKFSRGFNILTGETGAGKSILVGALGLLLGAKPDPASIRSDCSEALVSGVLNLQGCEDARLWLASRGIYDDEGVVILRRTIKRQGRGSIYIQSIPVTRPDLEEFAALIFDMHGQHDNQSLLNVVNHRKLLDRYAVLEELTAAFGEKFMELSKLRESFSLLVSSEQEKLRQMEILKFALEEIEKVNPAAGEDDELLKEKKILSNYEKIFHNIETVYNSVSELPDAGGEGALGLLRKGLTAMEEVVEYDSDLSGNVNQLQDAFFELEDFVNNIRIYRDKVAFDPGRLEIVEERLAEIQGLKKKYGPSIEQVLEYSQKCARELEAFENSESDKLELQNKISGLEQELRSRAGELTLKRKKAALTLEAKVEQTLSNLGMPRVKFQVSIEDRRNQEGRMVYSQYGADTIEFMISPNQGEPFKKLKKIVSGGEISRIMLALKSILADVDNISTLIFDEIDAGIGGEVAISVGRSLKQLASAKQVLCITHLATIAARAENHIIVKKEIKDNRTVTNADILKGEALTMEISRMLSGDHEDQVSLIHAEELLRKYGPLGEEDDGKN